MYCSSTIRAWRKFENIHKSYKQANQEFDIPIVDDNNTALVAERIPLEAFTKHFPELKVSRSSIELGCKSLFTR